MEAEVEVTDPEPVLTAPLGRGSERVPCLARPPPAALVVTQPGERIEDAVEVR